MAGAFDPLASLSKEEHSAVERSQRRLSWRIRGFRVATVLAFVVLGVKLWDMQIVHSETYVDQAVGNRVRARTVPALRGVVYDRNNRLLIANRSSFDVQVDLQDLPLHEEAPVLTKLAKLLKLDLQELTTQVDDQRKADPAQSVTVATDIPWETLLAVKEDHMELPGVLPVPTTIRDYTDGPLLSHIEGYVSSISQDAYAKLKQDGYLPTDKIGQAGVESTYEEQLRGTTGLQHVEVDAGGREVKVLDQTAPVPGKSLQLTIDSGLQKDVETYLRWGLDRAHCYQADPHEAVFTADCSPAVKAAMARPVMDGGHGDEAVAMVMDVHSGEMLAMVSFPEYDNNVFSGRMSDRQKAAQVLTSHDNPLIDRALSAYAPGSTFKIITSAAALQDQVVGPTSTFSVPACWPGIAHFCNWNGQGYGSMGVVDALAQSNDIWMGMVVAGGAGIKAPLGSTPSGAWSTSLAADRLAWYEQQFGLGQPLGIDLPFEQKGLVPTTAWRGANFTGDDAKWFTGDLINVSIGQGQDNATPLQMLNVAATIANGGSVVVPHVGKAFLDGSGKVTQAIAPPVKQHVPVSPDFLKTVAEGIRKGVYAGSSVNVNLTGRQGCREDGNRGILLTDPKTKKSVTDDHAWWVGYAPYDNPQIAVVVWINDAGNAGEGADFAVPVARKIIARYFNASDARRYYGCDTPETTPANCAASDAWAKNSGIYTDQHEGPADKHDPSFPA